DRGAAHAARGRGGPTRRDGHGEQCVELLKPLVERNQLVAAVDQQVLPELIAPEHLEHQSAEVAKPLLAGAKQRAPLSSQQSGMRQRPPGRDLRSGGSRVGGSAKAREPRHARNLAAGSAAYDVACAAVIRTYGLRECVGLN